jgi:hypothetical protein
VFPKHTLVKLHVAKRTKMSFNMYAVTFQRPNGGMETVGFVGDSQQQVLYAALELYPDWRVVRVNRDEQWEDW